MSTQRWFVPESNNKLKEHIRDYLGAPQITVFKGLKEDTFMFIVSQYYIGKM